MLITVKIMTVIKDTQEPVCTSQHAPLPEPVQTHDRQLSCTPLPSLLWSCHMAKSFCSGEKRTRISFGEIRADASLWLGLGLLGTLNKLPLASQLWFYHLWKAFKVPPSPTDLLVF